MELSTMRKTPPKREVVNYGECDELSILNWKPGRYVPSAQTDIRKTFEKYGFKPPSKSHNKLK
jgi:hypothetical protein